MLLQQIQDCCLNIFIKVILIGNIFSKVSMKSERRKHSMKGPRFQGLLLYILICVSSGLCSKCYIKIEPARETCLLFIYIFINVSFSFGPKTKTTRPSASSLYRNSEFQKKARSPGNEVGIL